MGNNNSPLESLAAFAIVFVAGAASAIGMVVYTRWMRVKAFREAACSRGMRA